MEAEDRARSLLVTFGFGGFEDLRELDDAQRSVALEGTDQACSYIRSGLLLAAEDACLATIERVPDYLPIQMLLADVYREEGDAERAAEKYRCLIDLYRARKLKRHAIGVLKRALQAGPVDVEKTRDLISMMLEEGLIAEALRKMDFLAQLHLEKGEIDLGLGMYDEMVGAAPNDAWVHLRYGRTLEELSRGPEAVSHYNRSWELQPGELEVCWRLVRRKVLENSGENLDALLEALAELIKPGAVEADAAVEGLRSLVDTLPSRGAARVCLGVALARMGQLLEAEGQLNAALAADPEVSVGMQLSARLHLAQILLSNGQSNDSIALLVKGFEAARTSFARGEVSTARMCSYLRMMREVYERSQDVQGLLWVLEEMRAVSPDNLDLWGELAIQRFKLGQSEAGALDLAAVAAEFLRRGNPERGLNTLLDGKQRAPENAHIRWQLCAALLESGRVEDASLELLELADLLRGQGRSEEAADALRRLLDIVPSADRLRTQAVWEQILELDPGDYACGAKLAEAYLRMGQSRRALAVALDAAKLSLHVGDTQVARSALQTALRIDPWNLWALEQLGEVLHGVDERAQSLAVFRRLLALNPDSELAAKRILENTEG